MDRPSTTRLKLMTSSRLGNASKNSLTVVEPSTKVLKFGIREIWDARELWGFLSWRDIKIRYKQTVLGAAWALIQPLTMMLIVGLLLQRVAGGLVGDAPLMLYLLTGLVPWTFLSQAVSASSASLVGSANLISKIYFPRILLPLSSASGYLLDFLIGSVALAGMMVYEEVPFRPSILLFPLFVLFIFLISVSVGIFLSAVSVKYRDVRHAVPFLIQVWLFLSPVFYSPSHVMPKRLEPIYALNPMSGALQGLRWSLIGTPMPALSTLWISVGVMTVLLVGGLSYFRRVERTFADII